MTRSHSLAFEGWPQHVRSVTVVVAPGCNRHCDYCPQLERYMGAPAAPQPGARMGAEALKDVLREAVARSGPRLDVVFTGGEPLRSVTSILEASEDLLAAALDKRVSQRMYTNGELLTTDMAAALLDRGIVPRLSCPALSEASPPNGAIDRLSKAIGILAGVRDRRGDFALDAALVVRPSMVGQIASKVRWLLEQGVDSVGLSPVLGAPAAQESYDRDELFEDMLAVWEVDHEFHTRTGRHAVPLLTADLSPPPPVPGFRPTCTAGDARDVTVDVGGQLVGCALFAPSVNPNGAPDGDPLDQRWMRGADGRSCMTCAARSFCVPCLWEQWQEPEALQVPRFRCEFHLAALAIIEFRDQSVSSDPQRNSSTS